MAAAETPKFATTPRKMNAEEDRLRQGPPKKARHGLHLRRQRGSPITYADANYKQQQLDPKGIKQARDIFREQQRELHAGQLQIMATLDDEKLFGQLMAFMALQKGTLFNDTNQLLHMPCTVCLKSTRPSENYTMRWPTSDGSTIGDGCTFVVIGGNMAAQDVQQSLVLDKNFVVQYTPNLCVGCKAVQRRALGEAAEQLHARPTALKAVCTSVIAAPPGIIDFIADYCITVPSKGMRHTKAAQETKVDSELPTSAASSLETSQLFEAMGCIISRSLPTSVIN